MLHRYIPKDEDASYVVVFSQPVGCRLLDFK